MAYLFRPPIRDPNSGPRLPMVPNPPTVFDQGRAGFALMRHFRHHGGMPVCVLIHGTTVTEKRVPTTEDTRTATYHYLGGHEYIVSDYEANLLLAYDPAYDLIPKTFPQPGLYPSVGLYPSTITLPGG